MTPINLVISGGEYFLSNTITVVDMMGDNPDNKFAPYQRMANAIICLTRENGDCLPCDLLALGFTKQETIDLWHMSQAIASVELKLLDKKRIPDFKWHEVRYA